MHVERVIRPALAAGHVVISDRFSDSTIAYQGVGRDLGMAWIAKLSNWAAGDIAPDVVILLDIDPADGLARAARRGSADRMEQEDLAFHQRVRDGFRFYAGSYTLQKPDTAYFILDAIRPLEELHAEVDRAVATMIRHKTRSRA